MKWFRFLPLWGSFFLGACKGKNMVVVLDEVGRPIAGVTVVACAPSHNGPRELTDSEGRATVDTRLLGAQFINASKEGYETGTIRFPSSWPATVVLRKKL